MANTGSLVNQIGESFEQIGKDVVRETLNAPKDIVGKALESLGSGQTSKKKSASQPIEKPKEEADEAKQSIARAALEELAGGTKSKEPSDYQKKLQEEEQKRKEKEQQKKEASMTLQHQSTKRKRGDLFGLKAKKSSTEIGKNVRQD
ncbi:MAG: hypothetical protein AAB937_01400 [Patescibacteria group bacterium]